MGLGFGTTIECFGWNVALGHTTTWDNLEGSRKSQAPGQRMRAATTNTTDSWETGGRFGFSRESSWLCFVCDRVVPDFDRVLAYSAAGGGVGRFIIINIDDGFCDSSDCEAERLFSRLSNFFVPR